MSTTHLEIKEKAPPRVNNLTLGGAIFSGKRNLLYSNVPLIGAHLL